MAKNAVEEQPRPRLSRFFSSPTSRVAKAYAEYADALIEAKPFRRATRFGLLLIVLSVAFSFFAAVFPSLFRFDAGMAIAMLTMGGVLLLAGVIGENWIKMSAANILRQDAKDVTAEILARQNEMIEGLTSHLPGRGNDERLSDDRGEK
ncbi:hypothetical protein [Methylobacterium komagatae]